MATQKQVTIIARYAHKTDGKLNGTVTYLVRASNRKDTYCTTLIDGKASGCSCPAKTVCYHKKQLEAKEAARKFAAKSLPKWTVNLVNAGVIEIPGKVKVQAPKLVNPFKKPSTFILDRIEAAEHKASVLAEMRELKERRETAPLNGNRAFSILR